MSDPRTWFLVINNPEKMFPAFTPEQIVDEIPKIWIGDKPATRSCAVSYEIGDTGTPHLHIVAYDENKISFERIKKIFPQSHIEPMRGNKKQAMAYMRKEGKFAEKAHTIVIPVKVWGKIKDATGQGKRTDLDRISKMIDEGYTVNQILDENFEYRKYTKMIRDAYYRKRYTETPAHRNVEVIWHTGESGAGKTYVYVNLVKQYGDDAVYLLNDYSETGGMDNYNGEPILFMDEFKGNLPFYRLLTMLDGYRAQVHARYSNVYALWDTVHITSIFTPDEVYEQLVNTNRNRDTFQQLIRRINTIVYHYKENGEYKAYSIPSDKFISHDDLKMQALKQHDEDFLILSEDDEVPFD